MTDNGLQPAKKPKRRDRVAIRYDAADDSDDDNRRAVATSKDNGILPSSALRDVLHQDDNAALALHYIPKGSALRVEGKVVSPSSAHDIPEGHRFTSRSVAKGEALVSWGIPFGTALMDLPPGQLLCNRKSIMTFADRKSTLLMPTEPNFKNIPFKRHEIDEAKFRPGNPTRMAGESVQGRSGPGYSESAQGSNADLTFTGFKRGSGRGVGTRNFVVIIGTSARVAGIVRWLENKYKPMLAAIRRSVDGGDAVQGTKRMNSVTNFHGVVAVAHTEGDGDRDEGRENLPNNYTKVVRTLCGFAVHPNVGGLVIVDEGNEVINGDVLMDYMHSNKRDYPIHDVPHRRITVGRKSLQDVKLAADQAVADMIERARSCQGEPCALSHLVLAQQCGGSDAFSGISANPLAGWLARALVMHGGSAVLAETDELIGAEGYILSSCRDLETANKFLALVDRFYRYTNRRGHSPEGNPSGGNLFRGLYNITLKSAGAAMKKLPDVRLDHVLEYGERIRDGTSGYMFMDSPGNDLESIAGQVASGCNVILFTTGNGSVTNFPFVPTLKALTTTARFDLLHRDMDINAGLYLDGRLTLDELGGLSLDLLRNVASGVFSKGELAGHHQVQLWRNWCPTEGDSEDAEGVVLDTVAIEQESASETGTASTLQVTASSSGKKPPNAVSDDKEAEENRDSVRDVERPLVKGLSIPASRVDAALSSGLAEIEAVFDSLSLIDLGIGDRSTESKGNRHDGIAHPRFVSDRIGLVLPTSLCSSQVAVQIVQELNASRASSPPATTAVVSSPSSSSSFSSSPSSSSSSYSSNADAMKVCSLSGFVALPHTEGCGHSSGDHEDLVLRTLLGHLVHPCTGSAVLLEHGCEKTHNGRMTQELESKSIRADAFGFASIQLDGGLEAVSTKVKDLLLHSKSFATASAVRVTPPTPLQHVRVGIASSVDLLPATVVSAITKLAQAIVGKDGLVVLAGTLLTAGGALFQDFLSAGVDPHSATLGYGQTATTTGLHLMQASTESLSEIITGLAATGVEVILAVTDGAFSIPSHPLVPTIQCAVAPRAVDIDVPLLDPREERGESTTDNGMTADAAAFTDDDSVSKEWARLLASHVCDTLSRRRLPHAFAADITDFQLARAHNAVSL